jgi:hypothetical protein
VAQVEGVLAPGSSRYTTGPEEAFDGRRAKRRASSTTTIVSLSPWARRNGGASART